MIDRFKGKYFFLSNFFPSAVFLDDHLRYRTVEHAFQAAKSMNPAERLVIRNCVAPREAKLRGGLVTPLRKDWEQVKVKIMGDLLKQKFFPEGMKDALLQTGEAFLLEGNNWHDNFWGVCYCGTCPVNGKNVLGTLLMELRTELRIKS